jgi:hypothetical protein
MEFLLIDVARYYRHPLLRINRFYCRTFDIYYASSSVLFSRTIQVVSVHQCKKIIQPSSLCPRNNFFPCITVQFSHFILNQEPNDCSHAWFRPQMTPELMSNDIILLLIRFILQDISQNLILKEEDITVKIEGIAEEVHSESV